MAITLSPQALEDKITALFVAAGSSATEARQVAANLVLANLSGHDSHGVGMAPRYIDAILEKGLIPNTSDPCSNGGDSWLYNLDILSGSYIKTQTSTKQGGYKTDKAIMGINSVQYDGTSQSGQIITNADGSTTLNTYPTPGTNAVRRTGWRELTQ